MRLTPQSFISGYCARIRAAMPSISAWAAATVTPGRRRPATNSVWLSRISFGGSIVSGTQMSPAASTVSAGGATPTMVYAVPFNVAARPTMSGAPPKRRFHSDSLIIATGAAPGFSSASANPCPTIGFTPSRGSSDGETDSPL